MSGAVPPISPVTGGAIYEATAKAEAAYADAERSADVEYTELQKLTSKGNQAELTKAGLWRFPLLWVLIWMRFRGTFPI